MKEELLPINLLRFFAAIGVWFFHLYCILDGYNYISSSLTFLNLFGQYGYLGVSLFFIISGFVITLNSENRTFLEFIVARFIRLFPVFWVCVSITAIFVVFSKVGQISFMQYVYNLTMLPHDVGGYDPIDGVYWTLKTELKFYFIVALILLIKPRISIDLQKCVVLLTLPLLYTALFYDPLSKNYFDNLLNIIFNSYGERNAQYFMAGILFYGLYKNNKNYYSYIGIAICWVVAIIHAVSRPHFLNDFYIISLHITIFFSIFLLISLRKITNTSIFLFSEKQIKTIAKICALTYPVYLLHNVISWAIVDILKIYNIPMYIELFILFFTILSIALLVNKFDLYINTFWKKKQMSLYATTK